MMSIKLSFVTLNVFTSRRFLGNPLAIVHVPNCVSLTQEKKQLIAREFNLSETVFLHDSDTVSDLHVVHIFTPYAELPFAGHPTIGTGWYLFSKNPNHETINLRTKAGDIPVSRLSSGEVQLKVPTNFKVHAPILLPQVKGSQPNLTASDYANGLGAEAVASIVKGMTFLLLQVSSKEALGKLQAMPQGLNIPELGDWAAFVGVYAFLDRGDGVIRTRMFDGATEDPATGSAASTLSGWLGQRRGPGNHKFQIIQGVEMGRESHISVDVKVGGSNVVEEIFLGGDAVEVQEGSIQVPDVAQ